MYFWCSEVYLGYKIPHLKAVITGISIPWNLNIQWIIPAFWNATSITILINHHLSLIQKWALHSRPWGTFFPNFVNDMWPEINREDIEKNIRGGTRIMWFPISIDINLDLFRLTGKQGTTVFKLENFLAKLIKSWF